MTALQKLRERMAELADLDSVEMLLDWDQLVMMPAEGAGGALAAARRRSRA